MAGPARSLLLGMLVIAAASPHEGRAGDTPRGRQQEIGVAQTPAKYRFSPTVVADPDGSVRLAHSVLVTDETGATDYRQSEALSERVWAKKLFQIESADVQSAELFVYGEARKITVNGKSLEKSEPLVSSGWTRAKAPPGYLKAGTNEVILSGGGSLLLEPGRGRGRSLKSRDGGRTWSAEELGAKSCDTGEYLVRLRLTRYAPRGSLLSPLFSLWSEAPDRPALPGKVTRIKGLADLTRDQPEGTRIRAWLRTGSTPSPGDKDWTAWRELDRDETPEATNAGHRWAQLRLDLSTDRPQQTPRLRPFFLACTREDVSDERDHAGNALRVVRPPQTPLAAAISSVPFVYEQPSPRLKLLREKYQLDKVIAPGKTEMEQLMLLRYWVRNQCHRGWASHPALWIPPWDSLLILESRDRPDCLVMCTHFACIFTQCCLALGWNARHCILDHHCVSEVWVDQPGKWVMMDTGNSAERADVGLHFQRGDVPLSARELQHIYRSGKTEGVQVYFTPERLMKQIAPLCRPAPPSKGKPLARPDVIPLAELKKYPVCQLDNYRRYAFPPRNNFLTTLYPGEPEHGFSNYFYDGYCWVGDSPDDPRLSPEYSRHLTPQRPQDIDWTVNGVRIHLSRTAKPGELQVDVESHVPNLARLEKAAPEGEKEQRAWQATASRFVWQLKRRRNVLEVRGVNAWGRAGRAGCVQVEWTAGK